MNNNYTRADPQRGRVSIKTRTRGKTIIGPTGEPIPVEDGLLLFFKKVGQYRHCFFRLFWRWDDQEWICREAPRARYRRRRGRNGIVKAGQDLARQLGIEFDDGKR